MKNWSLRLASTLQATGAISHLIAVSSYLAPHWPPQTNFHTFFPISISLWRIMYFPCNGQKCILHLSCQPKPLWSLSMYCLRNTLVHVHVYMQWWMLSIFGRAGQIGDGRCSDAQGLWKAEGVGVVQYSNARCWCQLAAVLAACEMRELTRYDCGVGIRECQVVIANKLYASGFTGFTEI